MDWCRCPLCYFLGGYIKVVHSFRFELIENNSTWCWVGDEISRQIVESAANFSIEYQISNLRHIRWLFEPDSNLIDSLMKGLDFFFNLLLNLRNAESLPVDNNCSWRMPIRSYILVEPLSEKIQKVFFRDVFLSSIADLVMSIKLIINQIYTASE